MSGEHPLSALLSQALVAFILEFDNEFEHQVPHRTTDFGATPGAHYAPWLVSTAMWTKFLRFVPEDGITVRELLTLTHSDLKALEFWLTRLSVWWGYLVIEPRPVKTLDPNAIVRPTPGGRKAIEAWRPLIGVIEDRWRERFGTAAVSALFESLNTVAAKLDPNLADSLPILGYGLSTYTPDKKSGARGPARVENQNPSFDPSLPALLSKVLLAFAIEYEQKSTISLAISANLLRLLGKDGVAIRDLPRLSGVSSEAVTMAYKYLVKLGCAAVVQSPASRTKLLTLTPRGRLARAEYHQLTKAIEERWQTNYGKANIDGLRKSLEGLIGDATPQSLVFAGLEPYLDNWRARIPKPETLPHFPMILHRGGFPDGS